MEETRSPKAVFTMAAEPDDTPFRGSESAIDDDEVESDFAEVQRTISQRRREEREASVDSPIQRVLPFQFSPNIRPLTSSDHAACVALERAAFPNPAHQASSEKVRPLISPDATTMPRPWH